MSSQKKTSAIHQSITTRSEMTKSITSEKISFAQVVVFISARTLNGLVGRGRHFCHRHTLRVSIVAWSRISWIGADDQRDLQFEVREKSFRFDFQFQVVVHVDVNDGAGVFTRVTERRSNAGRNAEWTSRFDQLIVIVDNLRNGETHQF